MKLKITKIHTKLALSLSIIILIMCLVLFISYGIAKNSIQTSTIQSSLSAMELIGEKIDSEMAYISNVCDLIYNSSEVNYYINQMKKETSYYNRHYNYIHLNKILGDFTNSLKQNNNEYEIILCTNSSDLLYYSWTIFPPKMDELQADINQVPNQLKSFAAKVRSSYNSQNPSVPYLYLYKTYTNVYNKSIDFHIIIGIRKSYITSIYSSLLNGQSTFTLVDQLGKPIIITPDASPFLSDPIRECRATPDSTGYFLSGSDKLINIFTAINTTGWKLVQSTPQKTILKNLNSWTQFIIWGMLLLFASILAVSLYLATQIARPINRLYKDMQKIKSGNWYFAAPAIRQTDEIGHLSIQFYDMVEQIKILNQKMLQEEQQKRILEIEALQAQINPHFMYNTISSIKMLLRLHRNDQVFSSLSALVEILKNTIGKVEQTITLEKEVAILESYIYIQKMRYSEFQFTVDLPEDLKHRQILRFILQPFVENSIFHGYQEVNSCTEISLRFRADYEAETLIVTISDNGSGIDEETLGIICSASSTKRKLSGIGIGNVINRIRLTYGVQYGVQFDSRLGQGTTVILTLPLTDGGLDEPSEQQNQNTICG